ncbi:MAG: leucine-rich repeat domain-containing protein [Mycoplasmataceae bacterium]|nr:leucine-rich repeat domain-containing protein [Mycoplasmataceae bacterium]
MKKKTITLLSLAAIAAVTAAVVAPVLTCRSKNTPQSIYLADGSNWEGRTSGTFAADGFFIDEMTHTITYFPHEDTTFTAHNLTIPNKVIYDGKEYFVEIGAHAFMLAAISGSVTIDSTGKINDEAFAYNANIESVIIGKNVTDIGDKAFYNCTGITHLTLGDSVKTIGYGAFSSANIQGDLVIPNSVTVIGEGAFGALAQEVHLHLGNHVQVIGRNAFQYSNIVGELNIPNSVTSIGVDAFKLCPISSLILGNGLITIAESAFQETSIQGTLTIPSSVTSIGQEAFYGCESLDALIVEGNSTDIGYQAFYDTGIVGGTDGTNNKITCGTDNVYYLKNGTSYYCFGKHENVIDGGGTNPEGSITIKEGTKVICQSAFEGTGIAGLTNGIPSSVTTLGSASFSGCSTFAGDIVIPNGVSEISSECFYNTGIQSVNLGSNLKSIDDNAFDNCTFLAGELTIPGSVTRIGDAAFRDCQALTGLIIGDNSAVDIGNQAFKGTGIVSGTDGENNKITCGDDNVYYLKNGSSYYCFGKYGNVTTSGENPAGSIAIKEGTKVICNSAFANLSGITNSNVPNTVLNICAGAFDSCTNLSAPLNFSNNILAIGRSAFHDTKIYGELTIPSNVISIGDYAFDACNLITTLTINGSASIGEESFAASQYGDPSTETINLVNYTGTMGAKVLEDREISNLYISSDPLFNAISFGDNFIGEDGIINIYTPNGKFNSYPILYKIISSFSESWQLPTVNYHKI